MEVQVEEIQFAAQIDFCRKGRELADDVIAIARPVNHMISGQVMSYMAKTALFMALLLGQVNDSNVVFKPCLPDLNLSASRVEIPKLTMPQCI